MPSSGLLNATGCSSASSSYSAVSPPAMKWADVGVMSADILRMLVKELGMLGVEELTDSELVQSIESRFSDRLEAFVEQITERPSYEVYSRHFRE